MSDIKLTLDNAQSGGPQLVLIEDDVIIQKVWLKDLRSPDEGVYFSTGPTTRMSLDEFPEEDGIPIYPS